MLTLIKNWTGKVEIDGVEYDNISQAIQNYNPVNSDIHIVLKSLGKRSDIEKEKSAATTIEAADSNSEYEITVKQYMTRKATPEFDFMAKFNNNNPMPMRIMQGTVEKETKGMVYMKLHGLCKPTITCYCCGKELTNPVSRHYGVGPICLSKLGIVRDIEDVENIKEELVNITWEGWVIRSSIISKKEVKSNE